VFPVHLGGVRLADLVSLQARLFQESDYLIMKSTKPIAAGEQIFNDYGPLPRSDLLRMYGYTTENYAIYDVVEVSHDILVEIAGKNHGAKDTAWLKRAEQLEELGIIDDGYAIPRPPADVATLEDAIPGQVHMLLRALCDEGSKKPKEAITIKETALLQSALTKRISEYETSLDADRSALARLAETESDATIVPPGCSKHRYVMALQVRIGEKEILHQLIGLCQHSIAAKTMSMTSTLGKRPQHERTDTKVKKAARTKH
jgi:N-lysine methyltransferase SETD6